MNYYADTDSWFDTRIEIRKSSIHRFGSFVKNSVKKGEILIIWDAVVMLNIHTLKVACTQDVLECQLIHSGDLDDFLNHSCDPNLWMNDDFTLSARRDIMKDEELTIDYTMFEKNENWISAWACGCGSPLCRKKVTGGDWRLERLRKAYSGHFSSYNNKRIMESFGKL